MRTKTGNRLRKSLRGASSTKGIDTKSKHFSFSFLFSIPANFVIGGICVLSALTIYENYIFEKELWSLFSMGFIGALTIVGTSKIPKFRTFIHELKHLVLVVMSGNRVTDFHVDTHTGHVQYQMYSTRAHFGPTITLAPYFFPLFSLPVLIACLVFQGNYQLFLAFILGFSLAADISLGFTEMHPHQSDLRRISGGFLMAAIYLAAVHLMWTSLCSLWLFGGRSAYVHAGYLALELMGYATKSLSG